MYNTIMYKNMNRILKSTIINGDFLGLTAFHK